jgi:translocation and assembly module TamA
VRFGPVTAQGSSRVDADFITYMADLPQGEPYDPDRVTEGQDRISGLGVFNSVRFQEGDVVGPDGTMPITILVEDRKPRTIGIGGTYSTLDGLGLNAYWLHRNLFGRAEQLRFDASVEGLLEVGGLDTYDYNLGVSFNKPGVISPETNFISSLIARQLDFDTYRETSITAKAGLSRQFNEYLSGDIYGVISKGRYEDDFGTRNFLTFGAEGSGEYDRRDNNLNPTRGYYLAATALPFYEAEYSYVAFRGTAEGRSYLGFGEERDLVLAGRAKVGTYFGASVEESPPNLLFFAGGGGSVRGYPYQSIGVSFTENGETFTTGGRSLLELSGEVRYRFTDSWGGAAFVDAGLVDSNPAFDGDNDVKVGTGLGVRYFTGFGPLRVDVAVPLEPGPDDDKWALYIGIGQAF